MTGRRVPTIFAAGQVWRASNGEERTIVSMVPASAIHDASVKFSRDGRAGTIREGTMIQWIRRMGAEIVDA